MANVSLDEEFRQLADDFQKRAKLTPQQLNAFKLTKVEDIRRVLVDVQKKHEKDRALIWLKRIDPFINTFLEFGNIVEVFLNTSEFLAFVWGPLKWLLWITRNYSKAMSSLLDLYRDLSKQLSFLQAVKAQMHGSSDIRQVLVYIYKDILEFHVKAMEFFEKGRWGQLFESNWRGFTDQISQIKDSLSLNSRLIDSNVSIITLEEVRLLRKKYEDDTQDRIARRTLERKTAVLNWLSPSSREISFTHENHIATREANPGSCEWVTKQAVFLQWYDLIYCRTPLLWISGKPGAGKSVVASYIIQEVQKHPDISAVYFYFSHRKPLQDNFLAMAITLVAQLMQHDALLDYLHSEMVKGNTGTVSTKSEAAKLLDFSLRLRKSFVILDGLDECDRDERLHICEWFRDIIEKLDRKQHGEIRCLFVCQEDGFAKKDLRDVSHLRITPELNWKDILSFSRIAQDSIEASLGQCPLGSDKASISEIVTSRANGMFIYAKLVLSELKSCPTRGAIRQEWSPESFPDGIAEVYARILHRLESEVSAAGAKFRNQILTLICIARRPLRWFEIQAAISLDLERKTINEDDDRTPWSCEDICASFAQVQNDETVVLVHSTARDFLIDRKVVITPEGDLELCRLSISYLNFEDFDKDRSDDDVRASLLQGRYGFFEYAVLFWPFHLLSAAKDASVQLLGLSNQLAQLISNHWLPGTVNERSPLKIERLLESISTLPYYRGVIQAVVWTRRQLLARHESKLNKGSLDLFTAAERFRAALKDPTETLANRKKLQLYYGKNVYKCPRPSCQFFSVGFETTDAFDSHVNRHDRPFLCTVDGCYLSILGCVDEKSLKAHVRESHGYLREDQEFPSITELNYDPEQEARSQAMAVATGTASQSQPKPVQQARTSGPATTLSGALGTHKPRWQRKKTTRPARVVKHPMKFECTQCSKSFTRASNLRAHKRAHANERPFFCTVCSATFVRLNDKKRHERSHGERQFVCGGVHGNGVPWGCGQSFWRKDALDAHFRTELGEQCRKESQL